MLKKKTIIELPFIYTANEFYLGNQLFIGVGSERGYPAFLINAEDSSIEKVADGPGGMMSFLPFPESTGHLYSIMGLFPPFIGADAGVYHHTLINRLWTSEKVLSLPFAHRCEILKLGDKNHLFISTISLHKDNPSDWSRPGEVHHIMIDNMKESSGETQVLIDNLFRNHGMAKIRINGIESVCVSGAEGIFAIQPGSSNNWEIIQLFDREVSEFSFFDIDNDGQEELVTIEPFHGNKICIYKKSASAWQKLYSSSLSFGHGLATGKFNDRTIIAVGNRSESGALEMHVVYDINKIKKSIIEEHVGPTQIKVFHFKSIDYIMSANQMKNEVALYY